MNSELRAFVRGVHRVSLLSVFLSFFLWLFPFVAQAAKDVEKPTRMGFSTGPLMPKGVSGVREIVPLTAIRYSTSSAFGFVEVEGAFGNANGNAYSILSGRLIYDFELGLTNGIFTVGGDFHYFSTVKKVRTIFINGSTGESTEEISYEKGGFRNFNGWHLGFGITADVTRRIILRGDTFLRYSPGQTGYVGIGVEVLLDQADK